jgi:hypothetical protein
MTDIYHETLARRMGFKPFKEFTPESQLSVLDYCEKHYPDHEDVLTEHWWKESNPGDRNWVSYDVQQHNRINAPHLRGK